jgi:nucleotide-binding universal stress UspA family protein
MNEHEREPVVRRILVALDASLHSLAALEAASELAGSMKAELVGVYVEDINLLHLAGLPFAREISYLSVAARPLNSLSMERELRMQAERIRTALAGVAERRQLRWSFRVVRGRVSTEILTAAQDADMLAIGRASAAMTRHIRLGTTAREVVSQIARPLLLLQHGHTICHPVQLVYDGSATAQRAMTTAVQMALAAGGHLTVMIIADTLELAQRLREETAEHLQDQRIQGHYLQLITPTADELAHALRGAGGGTLIMAADNPLLQGEGMSTLLEAIDCSVLLIR